jgi:hypothetical protein
MHRSLSRAGLIISAAALLGAASAVAVGQAALAAPATGAQLTRGTELASASAASSAGLLNAVAAVSAKNVWAVGCSGTCHGRDSLILHWNGEKWSKVASPDPGAGLDELTGVSAVSASNVWAVGYACSVANCGDGNVFRTLVMHWNGKKWSTVASPDPSTVSNLLYGVTAVSATDVWAAGSATPDVSTHPATSLVLHWNGKVWSRVHSPTASGASTTLYGISAGSATDVWAVGNACIGCGAPRMTAGTFTMHWNGKKWSRVPSPGLSTDYNVLFGVKTLGPDDAWAVGDTPGSSSTDALIVHWNGKDWSQAASANPGSAFNDANAVSAVSARSIWTVGVQSNGGYPDNTLTEQRTGGAWTAVDSPDITTNDINMLAGVAAISYKDVVAVGWVQTRSGYRVLILNWNGTRWAVA